MIKMCIEGHEEPAPRLQDYADFEDYKKEVEVWRGVTKVPRSEQDLLKDSPPLAIN